VFVKRWRRRTWNVIWTATQSAKHAGNGLCSTGQTRRRVSCIMRTRSWHVFLNC